MYCGKCNKSFDDTHRFCPECGSRLTYSRTNSHRKKSSAGSNVILIVFVALILIIALFVGTTVITKNVFKTSSSKENTGNSNNISDNISDIQLTTGTDLARAEYIKNASAANYTEIIRNPQNFAGRILRFTGCVEDIEETDFTLSFKLNVTNTGSEWKNSIYVDYEKIYSNEDPINNGDIITIYGEVFNNENFNGELIPYMIAKYTEFADKSLNYEYDTTEDEGENVTGNTVASSDDYLFPSDKKKITEEDLEGMSEAQIALIRNEIYARHGYIFTNESYAAYFNAQDWYVPNSDFSEDMLNETEKYNKSFIVEYEKEMGWR